MNLTTEPRLPPISIVPSVRPERRVAYVMSWYPAVTETFILHEMLELRRLGMEVEIFPLFGAAMDVHHPGSEELAKHVQYRRGPLDIIASQLYWLFANPSPYVRAWFRAA